MSSSLQQINISYQPKEDRLQLKVKASGNNEYRIWLTRRYTQLLLKIINEQMDKQGGIQELSSNARTRENLKKGVLEQKYEPGALSSYPLGENGFLASGLRAGVDEKGSLKLQILPEKGQGITFSLDKSMIYIFYNLLEQGLNRTDWNLQGPPLVAANIH